MQKKMASKISAGVLSAVLVLQGMFPTVAVMADEISETGSSETVIEETVAETSEAKETKDSEETKVSETSETRTEKTIKRRTKFEEINLSSISYGVLLF